MTTVHDLGYSLLFSNKVIFRQLLETFVQKPWITEIDFENIEKLNKSFISEQHRKHESDLIYKVKLKNKTAYIIILIEFQSKVQRFMAVRMLHYMMSFYLDFINQRQRVKKLPPLFPIVLYNGDAKWTAPIEIQELIDNNELLGEFGLQFKYFKLAENEFSPDKLLKIQNIVSTIFLAETHYDIDVLLNEFTTLFRKEDRQAVSLLLNWFKYLSEERRITEADFEQIKVVYEEGEANVLVNAIRKEKQLLIQQGRQEGRLEGKQEGRLEGELEKAKEIAKSMLLEGLSIDLIIRTTKLSQEEIEQLLD